MSSLSPPGVVRGVLSPEAKAALLRLSPNTIERRQMEKVHAPIARRHARKLSQVNGQMKVDVEHESSGGRTKETHHKHASARDDHAPVTTRTSLAIDTIDIGGFEEDAPDTPKSARTRATLEANLRRVSQESSSPTEKCSRRDRPNTDGSYSLSDASIVHAQSFEDSCDTRNSSPIPIGEEPLPADQMDADGGGTGSKDPTKKKPAWQFWKKETPAIGKQEPAKHQANSSTMPAPPPRPLPPPIHKSQTLPAPAHLPTSQSPPPAVARCPSPRATKNKESPRGGSSGRFGTHKRQKSSRVDDVHSPRSTPPDAVETASPVAPIMPAAGVSVSGLSLLDTEPAVHHPYSMMPASSPSHSSNSNTSRGSSKAAIAANENAAILASLMSSGLMADFNHAPEEEPESPPEPEGPKNSYEDSMYELKASSPRSTRPVVSSWTRTQFVPHIQPAPPSRLSSQPQSGQSSPRRTPVPIVIPSRSSSMIVFSSPNGLLSNCVSPIGSPVASAAGSPALTPLRSPIEKAPQPSELRQLISGHSTGFLLFLRHLQREYASESLLFWRACEDFLPMAHQEMQATASAQLPESTSIGFSLVYLTLYRRYIAAGSKCEINVSSSLREMLKKDALAHEAARAALLPPEVPVQRDSSAIQQVSLENIAKIEAPTDPDADGISLVANPLVALREVSPVVHSPLNKYKTMPLSIPLPITCRPARMSVTGLETPEHSVDRTKRPIVVATPMTSAQLAHSTYTHLLQAQAEIERLLTQDCLPRFKHSPLYARWKVSQLEQAMASPSPDELVGNSYADSGAIEARMANLAPLSIGASVLSFGSPTASSTSLLASAADKRRSLPSSLLMMSPSPSTASSSVRPECSPTPLVFGTAGGMGFGGGLFGAAMGGGAASMGGKSAAVGGGAAAMLSGVQAHSLTLGAVAFAEAAAQTVSPGDRSRAITLGSATAHTFLSGQKRW